ncbi:hypothetical protein G6F56_012896 [Rhizopus delemar]|nr:hypothetical protein G6F56_012896 [Rhizopus delemar]
MRSFSSPVWAQKCLIAFENNDDVGSYPLEALQAISSFFCQQKTTLFDHSYSEDNTIKFLYKTAKKCLNRIKKSLTGVPDIKKAERLIEKGLTYNASVKRQLSNISTDSESDLEFLKKLPVRIKRPPTKPQLADEIAFSKRFKTTVGRMNWAQCLTLRANFSTHVKNM